MLRSKAQSALHLSPYVAQTMPTQRQEELEEKEEVQMKADSATVQRQEIEEEEPLQGKLESVQRQSPEEEELLQGKFSTSDLPAQLQGAAGETENRTGMPSPLKDGLEALSGMDLSGLRVHNNSSKPSQLNALAYTQGQEIHVGPGQEKHLPHEGWHAVQQMQGRVKPTTQAKGLTLNDDRDLEKEADDKGANASSWQQVQHSSAGHADVVVDRKYDEQRDILQLKIPVGYGQQKVQRKSPEALPMQREKSSASNSALKDVTVHTPLNSVIQMKNKCTTGEHGAGMATMLGYLDETGPPIRSAKSNITLFGEVKSVLIGFTFTDKRVREENKAKYKALYDKMTATSFVEVIGDIISAGKAIATVATGVGAVAKAVEATAVIMATVTTLKAAGGAKEAIDKLLESKHDKAMKAISTAKVDSARIEALNKGLVTVTGLLGRSIQTDVNKSLDMCQTQLAILGRQLLMAARCGPYYDLEFINQLKTGIGKVRTELKGIADALAAELRVLAALKQGKGDRPKSAAALIQSWKTEDKKKFNSLQLSDAYTMRSIEFDDVRARVPVSDIPWKSSGPAGKILAHRYTWSESPERMLIISDYKAVEHLRDFIPTLKIVNYLPADDKLFSEISSLRITKHTGYKRQVIVSHRTKPQAEETMDIADRGNWISHSNFDRFWKKYLNWLMPLHNKTHGKTYLYKDGRVIAFYDYDKTSHDVTYLVRK